MRNGYFQLEDTENGTGVRIHGPVDGGEPVRMIEVADYLDARGFSYDIAKLKAVCDEPGFLLLSEIIRPKERESYYLYIAEDNMSATIRFYAPTVGGELLTYDELMKDFKYRYIEYGIQEEELKNFFLSKDRPYCTDIICAKGLEPRQGRDAEIQYFFNTDINTKPAVKEDGSVDFFNLNTVCACTKNQELARIIPADDGDYGFNVKGERLRPREVKKGFLKYGRNIDISDDRLSIFSKVDGHVTLVEGKVFVSNVLQVENVDVSTGNINFDGSVEVNGNVCANFEVRAKGNIKVKGVVEGALLVAGGDIIIERGVNGMSKGVLAAKGNIVSKFLENVTASAGGYVSTDSILHSKVFAGDEINVSGKKGFITGGHVVATNAINVKTLGSQMGAATVAEVGARPEVKTRYVELQEEVEELKKVLSNIEPTLNNFDAKKNTGIKIERDTLKHILTLRQLHIQKSTELDKALKEMEGLSALLENKNNAQVAVQGDVFPGTRIVISEVSMVVQKPATYCRFVKRFGDVKIIAFN
ncbi:MAG: DUF342 domain-containing protein [Lachnospiraceae bacterium]|nr:DUF342 domain-containing protein [Lachnospiraceae bacterium]MBR4992992.1 DUF342 domain-containing protein [Lachnospiraceae bacterium]MBR5945253.1 DUF342 domain-containing protein [Lachnospiraceae bacterium]